jgi:glycosyltransferase involved in cell wall biosynthesis
VTAPVRVAINAWFLGQPGTGSGQYLHGLLAALPGLAPEARFLLVTAQPPQGLDLTGSAFELHALASPWWRTRPGKVLFEQWAFPRICRQWRASVAHVPYWGSPLRSPVPTVVTVHDLIPLLLPAYRGSLLVRSYTRLAAASARRAVAILTDSLASKRDIEAYLGLPGERVACIYLAADPRFRPEPQAEDAAIRAHYGLPRRYVLYLAGHDQRKNVAALVEAFATVVQADDDVSLAIGGRLPEAGRPPFFDPRPLVEALGLGREVRLLGWVEEAHKPALYRGAACAVFPSRYEGFGLPVLEALACGTPLVASNASSLPEILGDAGFAVDPDDVPGLAGAILSCLVDETVAAELRRRGPAQAARFGWQRTAAETLAVYRRLARAGAEESPCAS